MIEMSIRNYYMQTAQSYLHSCILSAFILSVILSACLIFQIRPPFGLIGIPFIFFGYIHYQGFLLYRKRCSEYADQNTQLDQVQFFHCEDLLLAMAPAPALRLLLFHPNGSLSAEIREIKVKTWRWLLPNMVDKCLEKKYGLFDSNGTMLAAMSIQGAAVDVMLPDGTKIGCYDHKTKSGHFIGDGGEIKRVDDSSLYTSIFFLKGQKKMSKLQRGWLPVEWGKKFNVNTPVLSFEPLSNKEEKLMSLAAVVPHYEYADH
jgi:hypothetical protein